MSPRHVNPPQQWPQAIRDLACDALAQLAQGDGAQCDLQPFLAAICDLSGSDAGILVIQDKKEWTLRASSGHEQASEQVPERLIVQCVESLSVAQHGTWIAAFVRSEASPPQVLALRGADSAQESDESTTADLISAAADLISLIDRLSDRSRQLSARCDRQAAMLRIAATWQQESDSAQLLESIAQAATELLGAERASIFLWDRGRGVLVGRPALGVEGGQLEVDDSAGVVGAVLRSGQPKRWDASDSEAEVNRKVDKKLDFTTDSLLAVPMDNRRGKRIGVFEVINRIDGTFGREDEGALMELAAHAAAAIENTREREHLAENCDKLADVAAANVQIIGESPQIVAVRESAARVAKTDLSVLVLGKNGTGKEVLARTIHLASGRRREPFVAVNCAALVETLLESELFGHEKGAFTDAREMRPGKFEVASGGTLFLDEIGDMSLGGQSKLLRVLEEKVIVRVGGSTPIPIDVRVIAATNQPLADLVSQKRFREDLYFRLNVVTLDLPSLQERGDDIVLLAEHFLESFAAQIGRMPPELSSDAKAALLSHPWQGNIRELRNLMERISYLCTSDRITTSDLSFSATPTDPGSLNLANLTLNDATKKFQINHIQSAINRAGRNMTEAAQHLGLHRSNLYRKMKQLGIETHE